MFSVDKYDTLEYSWVKATAVSVRLRIYLGVFKNTNNGRPKKGKDDTVEDDKGGYPNIEDVMIIFGGP